MCLVEIIWNWEWWAPWLRFEISNVSQSQTWEGKAPMGSVCHTPRCPSPRQAHKGVSQCLDQAFATDVGVQNMKTLLAVSCSQFQLSDLVCIHPKWLFPGNQTSASLEELPQPFTLISFAVTDYQNHMHIFDVFMFYKNINIKLIYFCTCMLFASPQYCCRWSACTQEGVQFSNWVLQPFRCESLLWIKCNSHDCPLSNRASKLNVTEV